MGKKNKKANKIHQTQSQSAPSRLGKRADDIFSIGKPSQQEKPVTEPSKAQKIDMPIQDVPTVKQTRGRPIEHKEEWSKITVVLLDKQIHWLDQLASNIRLNTKAAVSRAELIRALIAAIEESETDLSQLGSETAIKNFVLEKLKK